jgi:hypothetical protein
MPRALRREVGLCRARRSYRAFKVISERTGVLEAKVVDEEERCYKEEVLVV